VKPLIHARNSARKWGGEPADYQAVHDWFDQTKAHLPDMRHRAVLHNAWGIYLAEQVFGVSITNSEGREVCVRDIGEQHVLEDLGTIPTLAECLAGLPYSPVLGAEMRRTRTIPLVEDEQINAD
jgi:hypothetical protein